MRSLLLLCVVGICLQYASSAPVPEEPAVNRQIREMLERLERRGVLDNIPFVADGLRLLSRFPVLGPLGAELGSMFNILDKREEELVANLETYAKRGTFDNTPLIGDILKFASEFPLIGPFVKGAARGLNFLDKREAEENNEMLEKRGTFDNTPLIGDILKFASEFPLIGPFVKGAARGLNFLDKREELTE